MPKEGRKMKKPFQNWTFKKHVRFVTAIHLAAYAVDLTLSYYLIKKFIDKSGRYDEALDYDLEFEE